MTRDLALIDFIPLHLFGFYHRLRLYNVCRTYSLLLTLSYLIYAVSLNKFRCYFFLITLFANFVIAIVKSYQWQGKGELNFFDDQSSRVWGAIIRLILSRIQFIGNTGSKLTILLCFSLSLYCCLTFFYLQVWITISRKFYYNHRVVDNLFLIYWWLGREFI